MKMTDIDLFYIKKTLKILHKNIGIYTFYWIPRYSNWVVLWLLLSNT